MQAGFTLSNLGFLGAVAGSIKRVIFSPASSAQTWVVPRGVTSVTGRLWGMGAQVAGSITYGGSGHYVSMGFNTTPGDTLTLVVANATDLFGSGRSEIIYPSIVLIAGGGGYGGVINGTEVVRGGNAGLTGKRGAGAGSVGGFGGGSGAGGAGGGGSSPGAAGSFHQGGNPGNDFIDPDSYNGGIGGGGLYGGGGGAAGGFAAGGGGGGSSCASGGYNALITGDGPNWNGDPYWNGLAGVPNQGGLIVLTYVG